jgi:hypothetical protein
MKYLNLFLTGLSNSVLFGIFLLIVGVSWMATSGLSVRSVDEATNILGVSTENEVNEALVETQTEIQEYTPIYEQSEYYNIKSFYSQDGFISQIEFLYPEFVSVINPIVEVSNLTTEIQNYTLQIKTEGVGSLSLLLYLDDNIVPLEVTQDIYVAPFKLSAFQSLKIGVKVESYQSEPIYLNMTLLPTTL